MIGAADFCVILLALYLSECYAKLGPRDLILRRRWFRPFGLRRPILYPGNGEWGWLLLNPFRPGSPPFCSPGPSDVVPMSRGVLVRTGPEYEFVSYEECDIRVAGSDLLLNSSKRVSFPATVDVGALGSEIVALAALAPGKRGDRIAARIRNRFDARRIQAAVDDFAAKTARLRAMAVSSTALVLLVFPVAAFIVGLTLAFLPMLALLLAIAGVAAALYGRASRELFPRDPSSRKWGQMIKMILYPLATTRCADPLSLRQLSAFHPIAVAWTLCGAPAGESLARTALAELRYEVLDPETPAPCAEAADEYRRLEDEAITAFLQRNGVDAKKLLRPPLPSDAANRSYCPRCGVQYLQDDGVCPDCGNITLAPFSGAVHG